MNDQLLKCPFCGGTPMLVKAPHDKHSVMIECRSCFSSGTACYGTKLRSPQATAIAAWNSRCAPIQREKQCPDTQ